MMRKLTWGLLALVLWGVTPKSRAQFGQPYPPGFGGPQPPGVPGTRDPFGQLPGVNSWGRPSLPGIESGRVGFPFNPAPVAKNRDERPGLGVAPHVPIVPVPQFRPGPETFKPPASIQMPVAQNPWWGRGLMTAIALTIAKILGSLCGRDEDRSKI
jgi:hypothetical protein